MESGKWTADVLLRGLVIGALANHFGLPFISRPAEPALGPSASLGSCFCAPAYTRRRRLKTQGRKHVLGTRALLLPWTGRLCLASALLGDRARTGSLRQTAPMRRNGHQGRACIYAVTACAGQGGTWECTFAGF